MAVPSEGPRVVLLLGGARAGKSQLAEKLARQWGRRVLYVATAQPGDEEMRQRAEMHRARRPAHWRTLEEPLNVADAVAPHLPSVDTVLLDCMTLWASNILLAEENAARAEERLMGEIERLVERCRQGNVTLLVVSNEVGQGVVPAYPLGRQFRDVLGRANQLLARSADAVLYCIAGIPIELKMLGRQTMEWLGLPPADWP
ncbi:MAG: bifunctional adenosylcobinamide kinase/adenosylcobinamide-phosphate guanylyltransferase [Anaerolineae bacterium]|nr:bifunctional adenosylcobinamide kinase/adenosylcobinamide-phosphate guanylyltransferase [Anaerolineae bacterium]